MEFSMSTLALISSIFLNKVNVPTNNNWPNNFAIIGQFFFSLFMFVVILLLAYFFTKWIAKQKYVNMKSNNIRVIEIISVGISSTIQLIKVGEKYILIGVNKDKISYLTDVNSEDVIINDEKITLNNIPFDKFLNKFLTNPKKEDSSGDNET